MPEIGVQTKYIFVINHNTTGPNATPVKGYMCKSGKDATFGFWQRSMCLATLAWKHAHCGIFHLYSRWGLPSPAQKTTVPTTPLQARHLQGLCTWPRCFWGTFGLRPQGFLERGGSLAVLAALEGLLDPESLRSHLSPTGTAPTATGT